jgi:glycosyltransferase involved in cell wall biosynthesis
MKIAIIVQRYGIDVNGGAEFHCRRLAENLITESDVSEITVLTSCARDHFNWNNYFERGESELNNIKVIRFPVLFHRLTLIQKITGVLIRWFKIKFIEKLWFISQGPFVPDLLKYIKTHKDEYDIFIFFTYLYYPTVFGLPLVKDKAILIPTAHDEPPIYFNHYKKFFKTPKAIAYNTLEEAQLVQSLFNNQNVISDVIGCGIDFPIDTPTKDEHKPDDDYILYLGRIEKKKNLSELFKGFFRFKVQHKDSTFFDNLGREFKGQNLKLFLAGRNNIPIPNHSDIISLGFVSEKQKDALMQNALALIMPSKRESLSLVILEAWARETPVIVHQHCKVTNGQNNRAKGGLPYSNAINFSETLSEILADYKKRIELANNGKKYVIENYSWGIITTKFINLINRSIGKV